MKLSGPSPWSEEGHPIKASGNSHLVVVGLNYHSCPITIREKFVIPDSCVGHALRALAAMPHVNEAVVLSTCNRTEVYAVVSDVHAGLRELESFFTSTRGIGDHGGLRPNFKLLREDVALHLFRVASGLDSLVLGEGQIMSQVKAAHRRALEAGTCGTYLDSLFKLALNCGKRVRSDTSMGRRAVSVSSASVELGRELLGKLSERSVLIIGAGRMAQICAKHLLADSGPGPVLMINRTASRLEQFAENKLLNSHRLNARLSFDERYQVASACDLVIVSTSASSHLLKAEELKKNLQPGKSLVIIDISVPRNVDPEVGNLDGVKLYHSDDLAAIVNKNLAERESLVTEAERIVFSTLEALHCWERSLLVAPTITDLRKKIEAIRAEYLVKNESSGDFEQLSRALINQILHHPTVQLKSTSDYQVLRQQAEALRRLFNLDPLSPGCTSPAGTVEAAPRILVRAHSQTTEKSSAHFPLHEIKVRPGTETDNDFFDNTASSDLVPWLDSSGKVLESFDASPPREAPDSVRSHDAAQPYSVQHLHRDSEFVLPSTQCPSKQDLSEVSSANRCGRSLLDNI